MRLLGTRCLELRIGRRLGSVTLLPPTEPNALELRIGRRLGSVTLGSSPSNWQAQLRIGRRLGSVTLFPPLKPVWQTTSERLPLRKVATEREAGRAFCAFFP